MCVDDRRGAGVFHHWPSVGVLPLQAAYAASPLPGCPRLPPRPMLGDLPLGLPLGRLLRWAGAGRAPLGPTKRLHSKRTENAEAGERRRENAEAGEAYTLAGETYTLLPELN